MIKLGNILKEIRVVGNIPPSLILELIKKLYNIEEDWFRYEGNNDQVYKDWDKLMDENGLIEVLADEGAILYKLEYMDKFQRNKLYQDLTKLKEEYNL